MDPVDLSQHALVGDGGMKAVFRPSPNFGERAGARQPSLIVLHYTGMATAEEAIARLRSPESKVSAHYVVEGTGQIVQLVKESKRAWHAGSGEWAGQGDVNSRSVGIEIANPGDRPFGEDQMSAVEELIDVIMRKWRIPAHRVIGHSDMTPGRKFDPGPKFDWRRLAMAGLSVWPEAVGGNRPDRIAFAAAASRFGYPEPADPSDRREFGALLSAFRSRFRPWARGALEGQDMCAITELADRHPAV